MHFQGTTHVQCAKVMHVRARNTQWYLVSLTLLIILYNITKTKIFFMKITNII